MQTLARKNTNRALQQWLTGRSDLTATARLEQMYLAHRLRNFVFGINAPQLDGAPAPVGAKFMGVAVGKSPPFAHDLVITDMVGSVGVFSINTSPSFGLQVNGLGTQGAQVGSFFGADSWLPPHYICDQTPQTGRFSPPDNDVSFKSAEFVPRMFPKGEELQCRWSVEAQEGTAQGEFGGEQLIVQSVFALCEEEAYACPSAEIINLCERYVKKQRREYFILDLAIPFARLPVAGGPAIGYVTAPQDRPLLIYGASSNLTGAQIEVRDESMQHVFCRMVGLAPENVIIELDGTEFAGALVNFQSNPLLLPIWGFAPDVNDNLAGIPDTWRYWPVPHFLAPGATLAVKLVAGLRDNVQVISTSGGLVTTNPAHIAFCCVTL